MSVAFDCFCVFCSHDSPIKIDDGTDRWSNGGVPRHNKGKTRQGNTEETDRNRGGRRGSRPWHWGRVVPRYQGRDVAAVFLPLSLLLPLFSVIWRPGWNYDNKRKKKLLLWLLSHYVNYIKQALFVCICVRFWCVCKPEQPGATCMLTCACTSVFVCLFACVGVCWKNVCVCACLCIRVPGLRVLISA